MAEIIKADLDDMVFEGREHDYGAYLVRKNYPKALRNATLIAILLFVLALSAPTIIQLLTPAEVIEDDTLTKTVVVNVMDLPPPPDVDETPPPPPPDVQNLPPPVRSSIEFKIPVPAPDNEVDPEQTITEMDSIKDSNPGLETVKGNDQGYDFGEVDGTGDVKEIVEDKPKPKQEDPFEFIMVESEAKPVNMDEVKKLIGYPPLAKQAGIQGKVVLRIKVDETGSYVKHVVQKSANDILLNAVEAQVKNLKFTPAIQGGKPIAQWITVPFDFKLK